MIGVTFEPCLDNHPHLLGLWLGSYHVTVAADGREPSRTPYATVEDKPEDDGYSFNAGSVTGSYLPSVSALQAQNPPTFPSASSASHHYSSSAPHPPTAQPHSAPHRFVGLYSSPSTVDLIVWAEAQAARDPSFKGAVSTLVLTLRDRPLPVPERTDAQRRRRRGNRRRGGAAGGGGSADGHVEQSGNISPATPWPGNLLRSTHEWACWTRILDAPMLYMHARMTKSSPLETLHVPETVLWSLKRLALNALEEAERATLESLDSLPPDIRGVEVPVLACLWQVILIYRQLIGSYVAELYARDNGAPTKFAGGQYSLAATRVCLPSAFIPSDHSCPSKLIPLPRFSS